MWARCFYAATKDPLGLYVAIVFMKTDYVIQQKAVELAETSIYAATGKFGHGVGFYIWSVLRNFATIVTFLDQKLKDVLLI